MVPERFIDMRELCRQLCMCRTEAYERMESDPTFPRKHKRGRKTLFLESQVQAWIQLQVEKDEQ